MFNVAFRSALLAFLVYLPGAAQALEFKVSQFHVSELEASQADYASVRAANVGVIFATENFEGFTKVGQIGVNGSASLSTAVGSFTTLGSKGSGSTAIDDNDAKGVNRGKNIAVRTNDDKWDNGGRQNTSFASASDKTFIDSNDTKGFRWVASAGGKMFDRLLFTLTDPGDQGKTLTIRASGFEETYIIPEKQPNGEIFNILVAFNSAVNSATLSLEKDGPNDGFSIDNVTVGVVPLPAALWLLLGVSGALVAAKRRSSHRAA